MIRIIAAIFGYAVYIYRHNYFCKDLFVYQSRERKLENEVPETT